MPNVIAADVERMRSSLFIERGWRSRGSSKFWVLLALASIIATAGVVADSTATVIGAMIVAPLMTPILGSALAVVLADRSNLLRSITLVLAGALAVVAISFLIGLAIGDPSDGYASNSQVAGRISPRLIDLLAALATGLVGAFALVRSDISDALPGVAIAISLVPPLAVVGLLLEVQRFADASQAALLFGTNVAAIVATGTAVMLGYRVREAAKSAGLPVGVLTGRTIAVVAALVVLVAVPLTTGTLVVAQDQQLASQARSLAGDWAQSQGWQVASVDARNGTIIVTALGPPPNADVAQFRRTLNENGLADADLNIRLIVGGTRFCAAGGDSCEAPITRP